MVLFAIGVLLIENGIYKIRIVDEFYIKEL